MFVKYAFVYFQTSHPVPVRISSGNIFLSWCYIYSREQYFVSTDRTRKPASMEVHTKFYQNVVAYMVFICM